MEKKQLRFKLSFFAIARLGEVDIKLQLGKPRKTFSKFLANYVQWPGPLFKKHRL